jgi:hypothetical protein
VSDAEIALGVVWTIVLGAVWAFAIYLPRAKRLRERHGGMPPQVPMSEQLRSIAGIIVGAVALTGLAAVLVIWQPFVGLILAPVLFYGWLTFVLSRVSARVESG